VLSSTNRSDQATRSRGGRGPSRRRRYKRCARWPSTARDGSADQI